MFARDKKLHFWAGLAISIVTGPFMFLLMKLIWPWLANLLGLLWVSFLLAAIVGALKEIIWDWLLKKGTPEFLDFLATCIGGFVGMIFLRLLGVR